MAERPRASSKAPSAPDPVVKVRKIHNGFLTVTKIVDRNGKTVRNERYSRKDPAAQAAPAAKTSTRGNNGQFRRQK